MAQVLSILGQQAPSATTETVLYTVPASTSAICSSIVVCNRGTSDATFRLSVSKGGGATADKDYLHYNQLVPANKTFDKVIGMTLATTDVVRVYASTANLSFNLFGTEIS